MRRYAIVVEVADGNFAAYVPDLHGCVATGGTVVEDGLPIPEPSSQVDYVEIAV